VATRPFQRGPARTLTLRKGNKNVQQSVHDIPAVADAVAGTTGVKDVYRLLTQRSESAEAARTAELFADLVIGCRQKLAPAADEDEGQLARSSLRDPASLSPDEACVVTGAVVKHVAPLALVDGCWLEPFLMAPLCHSEPGAALAREHRRYCRPQQPEAGRGHNVIRLLEQLVIPLGPPSSIEFHRRIAISAEAYELPSFLLSLAGSPVEHLTELVCAERIGRDGDFFRLPAWIEEAVRMMAAELNLPAAFLSDSRQSRRADGAEPQDLLRRFEELGLPASADQRRVDAEGLLTALRDRLRGLIVKKCSDLLDNPADGVAALMISKASSARYAHGKRRLSGRRLDELFEALPAEPTAVVDALAQSRWIHPGHPEKSRFLNELTDPAVGPMGKIFSREELALLRIWVRSLKPPTEGTAVALAGHRVTARREEAPLAPEQVGACLALADPASSELVPDARTVYYHLLSGRERSTAVREAKAFTLSWLSMAADKNRGKPAWTLGEQFDRDEFCDWFASSYLKMASASTTAAPDVGALYARNVLQGAPDNLVDGVWLQRITRDGLASEVQRLLYEIYWDEIGQGNTTRSHSNIYSRLLRSMELQLPCWWSREFAFSPLFVDEAFYVPAFRLAISEFPRTFLPEIVGVNLISEFHGLGSSALDKVDELRALGFDETYGRIHIADDNIELGHSAKARDAVLFLMDYADRLGATEMTWKRVLSGVTAMRTAYVTFDERLRAEEEESTLLEQT
jgi:hypothetical protein